LGFGEGRHFSGGPAIKAIENAMSIDPNKIKAASKNFGDSRIQVHFFYNRQKERYEFRVRWPEGRYEHPEIAVGFAGILGTALDHLKILQRRLLQDHQFLLFDFVELFP
jgi:hypothetical protein